MRTYLVIVLLASVQIASAQGPPVRQSSHPLRMDAATSANGEDQAIFGLKGVTLLGHLRNSSERPVVPACSLDSPESAALIAPWPEGIVPYEFNGNVSSGQRDDALAGMAVISSVADVTFVPRDNEPAYLHIRDDSGNSSSSIGFTGGMVTIRMFNWDWQGILIHEFMHALGYVHEHQRPDRDLFVQVHLNNAQAGSAPQFAIGNGFTFGPYDHGSLMHYGRCAFSVCCPAGFACSCPATCETIEADGFEDIMGQRIELSALDAHGLRSMYRHSGWVFVDPDATAPGTGLGVQPWTNLTPGVHNGPTGTTMFVLPGDYPTGGTWNTRTTIAAPLEGIVIR